MIYAGIGARATPPHIIEVMRTLGIAYAKKGYTLHTGAAPGADQAFAEGALYAGGNIHLFLPWPRYEEAWCMSLGDRKNIRTTILEPTVHTEAMYSVHRLHPAASKLSQGEIKLHARNFLILQDASFAVCWTQNGIERGGTGQGIRIAEENDTPMYNLGRTVILDNMTGALIELGELK